MLRHCRDVCGRYSLSCSLQGTSEFCLLRCARFQAMLQPRLHLLYGVMLPLCHQNDVTQQRVWVIPLQLPSLLCARHAGTVNLHAHYCDMEQVANTKHYWHPPFAQRHAWSAQQPPGGCDDCEVEQYCHRTHAGWLQSLPAGKNERQTRHMLCAEPTTAAAATNHGLYRVPGEAFLLQRLFHSPSILGRLFCAHKLQPMQNHQARTAGGGENTTAKCTSIVSRCTTSRSRAKASSVAASFAASFSLSEWNAADCALMRASSCWSFFRCDRSVASSSCAPACACFAWCCVAVAAAG